MDNMPSLTIEYKKKDYLMVRRYDLGKTLKNLTSITFSDVCKKDRRGSYYKTLAVLALSFCLLIVRQYDCLAEAVPQVNLAIISQIESSGVPSKINKTDHNGKGSRGLFQISEGLRADYNRLNRASISASDLFLPEVNTKVALWAFNFYYPLLLKKTMRRPVTVRNLIICHNAGCGKVNNPPAHTLKVYLPKYQRLGGKL